MLTLLASLLVLHLDFNTVQMKADAVIDALRVAAKAGYTAVLWEIENKVQWQTCPECVDPEAFTKDEFRAILAEADRLGLEPIPLFQTFGHGEYVLRHAKYAGWMEDPNFPACYCVSNPEVVRFQKAMLSEYRELFGPKMRRVHLGGDEALVFGTCPKCRQHAKMDLYASHLKTVSEELRAQGVKPGVWADMVLMGGDWTRHNQVAGETLGKLPPKDFTLWHWDYGYGSEARGAKEHCPAKVDLLTKAGYEVVLSGSTHSYMDSPFLPRYRRHRDNLAACAALVRDRKLAGLCVTSWSVHLAPKTLEYPLWTFAAKRLLAPGPDVAADFDAAVAAQWGAIPFAVLDGLTTWSNAFNPYDVRIRNYMKSGLPAGPGHLEGVLGRLAARKGAREKLLKDASAVRQSVATARAALPKSAPAELVVGSRLVTHFLDAVEAVASVKPLPALPRDEARRYYGLWQPPQSAERARRLAWSVLEQGEENLRTVLARRADWLAKSEAAKPKLFRREVRPVRMVKLVADARAFQGVRAEPAGSCADAFAKPLNPGDSLVFDFGEHLVGHLSLRLGERLRVMDSPCRLKFTFAELPGELRPLPQKWQGLCRSWYPDETVNFDFAPADYDLPRRYAFRYVKVDVVACAAGAPALENLRVTAETSADAAKLAPYVAPNAMAARIDRIALATLRDCMQTMFEDGPKRDRRLWLGDLRLEALADYQTYRNFDVVKRSLYLLAGTTKENGLVGTDAYEQPFPKKGGCRIYDYTALFPTVVLEYLEASGDRATAEDLWPLCKRQIELVRGSVDESGLMHTVGDWWYFIDHDGALDRQVPEQGTVIYALKRFLALAKALGREREIPLVPAVLAEMTAAARNRLWRPERGVFLGEREKAPSWLGQAWMVLSGVPSAADAKRALAAVLADSAAERPRTPYGYHYMTEALSVAGLQAEADRLLFSYWGGMAEKGADTFWECYVPGDDEASPYGNTFLNSACHAWSCGPAYLLRSRR